MKKLLSFMLLFVFPGIVLAAENSLTFAPPPSDYSVVFLSNLFGIVDGVLSGTGSQIMGNMFGVFNAAVLALGGIIIMYTLMVSTMNTAHEGQMLGQKWSSIWIPVRSTIGLALLIPKASGYCLMQIFVMWIVVQGVGAADKIWGTALSYLNRGGVIIQAQQINPSTPLTSNNSNNGMGSIATGAQTILAAQVCMLGLQHQLEAQRQSYLDAAQRNSGPCAGTPSPDMKSFCTTAVPDFLGTVNAVATQSNKSSGVGAPPSSFSTPMPAFAAGSPYASLNGICGTLTWNNISSLTTVTSNDSKATIAIRGIGEGPVPTDTGVSGNSSAIGNMPLQGVATNTTIGGVVLTPAELQAAQMSRAIAIQQMYMDLALVAQSMISNLPNPNSNNNTQAYSAIAQQPFGVPYTQTGTVCDSYSQGCYLWGPASTVAEGTLFRGTEFLNAINTYNGVMMPTLNLLQQMSNQSNATNSRAFITNANNQGWIMAGAYFFNLVQIQGSSTLNAAMNDSNTGLQNSKFDADNLTAAFTVGSNNCDTNKPFTTLCNWFNGNSKPLATIKSLIDASSVDSPIPTPNMVPSYQRNLIAGAPASSVYGFTNNSMMVQLPGQPGLAPLAFADTINLNVDPGAYQLPDLDFPCGEVKIILFKFCLGRDLGDVFYNVFFKNIYNFFMRLFTTVVDKVVMVFLVLPLSGMATIFQTGVAVLSMPGVNPIVALANMGVQYINFAGNLWIMLLDFAVTSALIPVFGIFIFALLSLAMPLLLAWVGIMTAIGFTTAYYIPILPYMIFTFGALSWLIAVIEAMVAAPIVALGVTHPEGHDAFGKGEAAIMILINIFLRPSMMIIGYIAAIALSYVGVWLLNAGFDQAINFIQPNSLPPDTTQSALTLPYGISSNSNFSVQGYTNWAGIYAFFFSILAYTSMYLIIVQKSFTLITLLPDKVLRWIGGHPESYGQDASQWASEAKDQQREAGDKTQAAQGQIDKQLAGYGMKGLNKAKGMLSGAASSGTAGMSPGSGPDSTPGGGDGGDSGGDGDNDKKGGGGSGGGGGMPGGGPGGGGGAAGGGGSGGGGGIASVVGEVPPVV